MSTTEKAVTCSILSIDAWRDDYGGWQWNNWVKIDTMTSDCLATLKNSRQTLAFLRRAGILTEYSKGRVIVDDDGYNIVVCDKGTRCPLVAIAYGEAM